jgi:anaerobic magnesium-protoporphyrin IX monomethyl ester cyclase
VRTVVKYSQELGLETFGFFMLGLPGETEETLKETVRFARSLDFDLVKATYTIPIPGSELFDELQKGGQLKSRNWPDFNYYQVPKTIHDHSNLDWGTVRKYFGRFYRGFYLRPHFVWKRLASSLSRGVILSDLKTLFQVKWWK